MTEWANVNSYIVKPKNGASKEAAIQALSGLMFDFDDNESFKEVTGPSSPATLRDLMVVLCTLRLLIPMSSALKGTSCKLTTGK